MEIAIVLAEFFVINHWSWDSNRGDKELKLKEITVEEIVEFNRMEYPPVKPNVMPAPPKPEEKPAVKSPKDEIAASQDKLSDQVAVADSKGEKDSAENPSNNVLPNKQQTTQSTDDQSQIFITVEDPPQFPGGLSAMAKFLNENIKYPRVAEVNKVQGRVICNFVVEKDGSISTVEVVQGVDSTIDREAVRVIQSMPKWKPGMHRGQPVRVRFTIGLVFRLQK